MSNFLDDAKRLCIKAEQCGAAYIDSFGGWLYSGEKQRDLQNNERHNLDLLGCFWLDMGEGLPLESISCAEELAVFLENPDCHSTLTGQMPF